MRPAGLAFGRAEAANIGPIYRNLLDKTCKKLSKHKRDKKTISFKMRSEPKETGQDGG